MKRAPQCKIPDETLAVAKKMYLKYESLSKISIRTSMAKSTVQYYVTKGWRAERELQKAELFDAMTESKRVQFTSITAATIEILERALTNLASRKDAPSMQEATKAAEIMGTLDRITRLDDGNPTDIISNQEKPLTVEVIREKLALDPFEVIEHKEKKDEKVN